MPTPARPSPGQGAALGHSTAGARAETLVGAEANTRPALKQGNGSAIALAAIFVIGAGGAGLWFMTKHNAPSAAAPERSVALASTAAAPAAATLAPASAAAEAAKPSESSATITPASAIRLNVSSEPSGATLLKNGFQVCDSTPCEVLAAANETVEFHALKGPLKGTAKVLAQRDQRVTIRLSPASAPQPVKHDAPATRMCEVEVDGLKILRACK
jgi:hypothetical protein